jgi:hypothetical protein
VPFGGVPGWLVRASDDVCHPIYPPNCKFLLKFALNSRASRRIVEEHRPHRHQRRTGKQELKRITPGPHSARADDGHVGQRLADLPHAAHRDRPDGRP